MGVLKFIIKFIWELPSNVLAILLFFFLGVDKFDFDKKKGICIVTMSYQGGLTLGCFIFVSKESYHLIPHEMGHIRQGWCTSWLYLLVIGLPSLIWCLVYKSLGKPYDWFYTERWLMSRATSEDVRTQNSELRGKRDFGCWLPGADATGTAAETKIKTNKLLS